MFSALGYELGVQISSETPASEHEQMSVARFHKAESR